MDQKSEKTLDKKNKTVDPKEQIFLKQILKTNWGKKNLNIGTNIIHLKKESRNKICCRTIFLK
jgi:hypothetical protein